jgi:Protein of unknown function (DUF2384)
MSVPSRTTPASRDPDETADLETLIRDVVPDPDVWKKTPNPILGGKRPMDLLNTPQKSILRDVLRAAKHGMAS